ncbi:MAG TPA: hypothetical protein VJ901_21260 [Thermoanaerobaculia bacterium]|nr:hypothetical protein [Thermoanaerobaculia bacterium]
MSYTGVRQALSLSPRSDCDEVLARRRDAGGVHPFGDAVDFREQLCVEGWKGEEEAGEQASYGRNCKWSAGVPPAVGGRLARRPSPAETASDCGRDARAPLSSSAMMIAAIAVLAAAVIAARMTLAPPERAVLAR